MRVLISKESKQKLFNFLKESNSSKNFKELSQKMGIPINTLRNWLYDKKKYLPSNLIPEKLNLEIIDEKPDNWGKIKGGKKTYECILKKYGEEELTRRRIKGGENSKKYFLENEKQIINDFDVDLNNPIFLEFYGALLGDGWLSALSYNKKYKKKIWWIGMSGHSELDKDYLFYIKNIIKNLFGRPVTIRYKKDAKAMEIILCHKYLLLFINKKLGFPIGLKNNLKIEENIAKDWNKIKYVIRGLFDTDGCFFFDKVKGFSYPNIEIHMKAPELISQIEKALIQQGFKPQRKEYRVRLKGNKQITKWMKEIGSSNSKHFSKYENWLKSPRGATWIARQFPKL